MTVVLGGERYQGSHYTKFVQHHNYANLKRAYHYSSVLSYNVTYTLHASAESHVILTHLLSVEFVSYTVHQHACRDYCNSSAADSAG